MSDTTRAEEWLPDRRQVLGGGAALALLAVPRPLSAAYDDDGDASKAIREITQGRPVKEGRVTLTLPELAENGNVVSLTVTVDSPMTEANYCKTIHIVATQNPLANIAHFHLTPRSGRARVQTNIRLATTQAVTALAEMSDGALWSGTASVLVTLSACIDGG